MHAPVVMYVCIPILGDFSCGDPSICEIREDNMQ